MVASLFPYSWLQKGVRPAIGTAREAAGNSISSFGRPHMPSATQALEDLFFMAGLIFADLANVCGRRCGCQHRIARVEPLRCTKEPVYGEVLHFRLDGTNAVLVGYYIQSMDLITK
jgi:hypothetical protein